MYRNAKYKVEEDYFEIIDTIEKAYILGFIYADGSVTNKNSNYVLNISQVEKDKDILEKIRDILIPSRELLVVSKRGKGSYSQNSIYRLTITNKKIVQDLEKIGFNGLKENRTFPLINKSLLSHFIRGYFDGDGFISISARGDVEVGITGYEDVIKNISIITKNKRYKQIKDKSVFKLRISGINNVLNFLNYIYKDSTIYLKRKNDIAVLLSNKHKEIG